MLVFHRFLLPLLLLLGFSVCFAAETPVDNKDHPMLSRMPGYSVHEKITRDFDGITLDEGDVKGEIKDATFPLTFEGRTTYLEYRNPARTASNFAIYKNYFAAIRSLGGKQLNEGFDQNSDGVSTRAHVFEIPNKNGQATVVLLKIDRVPGDYSLTIIEPAALKQDVKAGSIALELEKKGVATLYINFDENKAGLKADGVEAVSQIAALMAEDTTLKVSIEGHADNVGTAAANKKLSTERAQSVMQAVVAKGIAASRLSARGFGSEVAAADNRTEEGRAKNRRVELVKVK